MEILIVDKTIDSQAKYANFIESLPARDIEALNIKISIAGLNTFMDFIDSTDVLILGSGLHLQQLGLCRSLNSAFPNLNIICFVDNSNYNSKTLKELYTSGAKKIFSNSVSEMDILQEFMSISFKTRKITNKLDSKITVVMSPKGGTGCTSIAAALGEVASSVGKKVLLWDLDTRTLDLTRSLSLFHKRNDNLKSLLANEAEFNKKNFLDGLIQVDENTSLLCSQLNTFWSSKLFHDPTARAFISRLLDLAKYSYDEIIIDLGISRGYTSEIILQLADQILFITGDCLIGASATDLELEQLTKNFYSAKTKLLCNGGRITIETIKKQLEPVYKLGEDAWNLPTIQFDYKASLWGSSGKTLYSMGNPETKKSLLTIADILRIGKKVINEKHLLSHTSLLNIKLGS